jgi:hypothetical protein
MTPRALQLALFASYVVLACWYAARREWPQVLYWGGAAQLIAGVTWGMR